MANVKAINLIKSVLTILQDNTAVTWTHEELLMWLNDAQRQIVLHRPDSNVAIDYFWCVGSSKQQLPRKGLRLIEVVRNASDTSKKEAIDVVSRATMNSTVPGWYNTTVTVDIENYVYDERNPKIFWLYPTPAEDTIVEIIYSTVPTDVVINDFDVSNETINLDDIYANAILDFMLHRAYSKDADYASNMQRSVNHYNDFANALGIKTKAQA